MVWLVIAFIVALAVLGPFFGADTRDGYRAPRRGPGQNAR
jgi:hypothetical protein